MNPSVWALPGPAGFVEAVERDLREGRNVVVAMPAGGPLDIELPLRAAVGEAWDWREVAVDQALPPAAALCERLLPDAAGVPSARALAGADSLDGQIAWVSGVDLANWPRWRPFLQEYAHACRARPAHARLRVATVVWGLPTALLPDSDVCLTLHRWDGVFSELDMLLYAAHRLRGQSGAERALRVAVTAHLALWDVEVADTLAALPPHELLQPTPVLREIARGRGWCPDRSPSWEEGTLQRWDGRPMEHSASLALRMAERELGHRLWSAQAGVLLPLVEQRRREVVARVGHLLRLPYTGRFEVVTDPHDLEVYDLCRQLRGQRVSPRLRELVERLRRVRNALAHCDCVAPEDALSSDLYRELAEAGTGAQSGRWGAAM